MKGKTERDTIVSSTFEVPRKGENERRMISINSVFKTHCTLFVDLISVVSTFFKGKNVVHSQVPWKGKAKEESFQPLF